VIKVAVVAVVACGWVYRPIEVSTITKDF